MPLRRSAVMVEWWFGVMQREGARTDAWARGVEEGWGSDNDDLKQVVYFLCFF